MCEPVTISALSLGLGAISTGFGIVQAQQQAQTQAMQADIQYQNAQRQTFAANQQRIAQHQGQIRAEQASRAAFLDNVRNANSAANKTFVQEQFKMKEARAAASSKALQMYAKSIGGQGKVLASGATGQSVGLLMLDAERQAGFATAAETAKLDSKAAQAGTQMDIAQDQAQSSINAAYSRLAPPTTAPQLESMPVGMGTDLNLGIPEYNWA